MLFRVSPSISPHKAFLQPSLHHATRFSPDPYPLSETPKPRDQAPPMLVGHQDRSMQQACVPSLSLSLQINIPRRLQNKGALSLPHPPLGGAG